MIEFGLSFQIRLEKEDEEEWSKIGLENGEDEKGQWYQFLNLQRVLIVVKITISDQRSEQACC